MKYILIFLLMLESVVNGQSVNNNSKSLKIIVFSKTIGYRHEAIPTGIATLKELASLNRWEIFATEDSTVFSANNLQKFDLIIFLCAGKHILSENEQKAIEQFVESGKGLLEIHSGWAEPDWKWYHKALGADYLGHPPVYKAKVIIEDMKNPAMQCFKDSVWEIEDEWHSFKPSPRNDVHVLARLDENSYNVDDNPWFKGVSLRMGDHPIVWWKKMGKGIVFSSEFGHTLKIYSDPLYRKHIEGAIKWTAGGGEKMK